MRSPWLLLLVACTATDAIAPGQTLPSWEVSSTVTWSATGGTITQDGLYTAGAVPGVYRVIASIGDQADTALVTVTGGSGEQARMADSVVESISVQTHLEYPGIYINGWSSIVRPRLLELGLRHIRQKMTGDPAVWGKFRDLYTAGGIQLTGGCWPQGTNYSDAAHCISQASGIGAQVVSAFDGWNEVDGKRLTNWPAVFAQWQQTQWNTYKADPVWRAKPIFANSLAHASSADQLPNLSGAMDYGNMHSYPGGGGLPSNVSTSWIPQWAKVASPKPLVTTETGYHTCPTCTNGIGVSMQAQGKYLPRLILEYFNRHVWRTNLYEVMDEGTSTTDREHNWGLVKYNGMVKPSFTALKNLIALLRDPGPTFAPGTLEYTLSGALGSTHSALLQKRDGRFYLLLWQEVLSYNTTTETDIAVTPDAVTLMLESPATFAVYRLAGAAPIQTGSGTSIGLSVPDEVLIVEITP